MIVPSFTCPYCDSESKPTVDTTGEMPVGLMTMCDCPQSRAAWETQHRADIERRKNAARGTGVRSRSIVHVGRTPAPNGKLRYRSR